MTPEKRLEMLDVAGEIWGIAHTIGGALANKNIAVQTYLLVEGVSGSAAISAEQGDTADELIIATTADIITGVIAVKGLGLGFGTGLMVSLDVLDATPGDFLKNSMKNAKTEYWKYEKDFWFRKEGATLHYEYAKVLYNRKGPILDAGDMVVEQAYASEYQDYIGMINELKKAINSVKNLDVKIEVKDDGVLYLTMPDGTILAQGTDTADPIFDGDGNDYLYGMGGKDYIDAGKGNDTIYGGDEKDEIHGGAGNETLIGGEGADHLYGGSDYDTYIVKGNDVIFDSDHSGAVYLYGKNETMRFRGGKETEEDSGVYKGYIGGYEATYTMVDNDTLNVQVNNQVITINNYNKDSSSLGIELVAFDEEDEPSDINEVKLSISSPKVQEGKDALFTISLLDGKILEQDLTLDLKTVDGTATSTQGEEGSNNKDYEPQDLSITIPKGSSTVTLSVPTIDDEFKEGSENFSLEIVNTQYTGSETIIYEQSGEATIVDNEPKDIELTLSDASVDEATGEMVFEVSINEELLEPFSFEVMTIQGSATDEDYTPIEAHSVTIDPMTKNQQVRVQINDDALLEPDEKFTLAANGNYTYEGEDLASFTIANAGEGTIIDDDKLDLKVSIDDPTVYESEGKMTFTIKLEGENLPQEGLQEDLTLRLQTWDHTAKSPQDYEGFEEISVTIPKGTTQITQTIDIVQDFVYEGKEQFALYAYKSSEDQYGGYDLDKDILIEAIGIGTILDAKQSSPQQEACPVPTIPNFGFNFKAPRTSITSGGYTYSGGGTTPGTYSGGSHGSGGGSSSATAGSYSPPPKPQEPMYECHYEPDLFPVAASKAPSYNPSTPPIVFDLNGNDVTSLSLAASQALFDYDGDGIKEQTAWIEQGDALLAVDVNGNGTIDDATELFGEKMLKKDGTLATDGLDALRDFDSNGDGIIDANDEEFAKLSLWKDNLDGQTQEGELVSLSSEGVESISLDQEGFESFEENGNIVTAEMSFTKADGSEGIARDVWFDYKYVNDKVYFDYDGDGFKERMINWMKDDQGLMVWDKNGDGVINDGTEVLSTKMVLPNGKKANDSFSGLSAFDSNGDGVVDEQDDSGLAMWRDFNQNGKTDEGELLSLGDELAIKSIELNPYQNMLSGYDRNHDMKINSSDAIYNYIYHKNNPDGTVSLYIPDNDAAKQMLGDYSNVETIQTSEGEKQLKEINFYSGEITLNDTVYGTYENDKIVGNRRDNYLYGKNGRDIIEGNGGNDTISGGKGSDLLKGGSGDDRYLFSKGDGIDMVIDTGGSDTIVLDETIAVEDVIIRSDGTDINVTIKGNADNTVSNQIILKDWYNKDNRIEAIEFSDGTLWDAKDIVSKLPTFNNDKIYGTEHDDTITALNGDDEIYTMNGNDTLEGGKGDDTLSGGLGNDRYIFSYGDGRDIVSDTGGIDSIYLKDIIKDQVKVSANGNHIVLTVNDETTDELQNEIVLQDWYTQKNSIEEVIFSDGQTWDIKEIVANLVTDGDDKIIGTSENDTLEGKGGDDVIYGLEGNDTLQGGSGSDVLKGDSGDDRLVGGLENDLLYGGSGNDSYVFNKGDGSDIIVDSSGDDKLIFGEGITKEDLIFKQSRYDLIVAVKQEGVAYDELTDKITISNWFKPQNNVEQFVFDDGSTLKASDVAANFAGISIEDTIFADENAVLKGGKGDDNYVYAKGDGLVVIDDFADEDKLEINAGNDTLILSNGIEKDNVSFAIDSNKHLVITFMDENGEVSSEDMLVVKDWKNENRGIEKVVFSDGEEVTLSRDDELEPVTTDSTWKDLNYSIYGNEQDDITGSNDNETFDLGANNDIINAKGGDDTLISGSGEDFVQGGSGNDTYIFNKGDGKDTYYDESGNDTLLFGSGITKDDILLKTFDNNLAIALKEGSAEFTELSDRVIIKDWLTSNNRIETFKFEDGTTLNDVEIVSLVGTNGDDTIIAFNGSNDVISSKDGNDIIKAQDGDDTLDGGKGDDALHGGSGNDTYIFSVDNGIDTIYETSGVDKIVVDDSILIDDMDFKQVGDDLEIALLEDGVEFESLSNKMIIKDWFSAIDKRVEVVEFTNGKSIKVSDIIKATDEADTLEYGSEDNIVDALGGDDLVYAGAGDDEIGGGQGDDTIYGQDGNDILDGGDGNDTIYGQNDNDTLSGDSGDDVLWGQYGADSLKGGEGNDTLYGDYEYTSSTYTVGSDVLEGGKGNDNLYGGGGDDVYIFNRGDGQDNIYDRYAYIYRGRTTWKNAGNDTLRFGEGISEDDLILVQEGNNVIVGLKEEGKSFEELSDKITLTNFSYNSRINDRREVDGNYNAYFGIETFEFSDGTTWDEATIVANIGTDEAETIYGLDNDNTLEGGKGDDTLYGRAGDDVYVFNKGDGKDLIYDHSQAGNTQYDAGNDTLKFGEGIGADELVLRMDGNDLKISIGLEDSITVQNQANVNNAIERLELFDGSYMTLEDINRVILEISLIASENDIDLNDTEQLMNNPQIVETITSSWREGQSDGEYTPPIVLDFNANGITSTSLDKSDVYFDYDSDGIKEKTAWIESADGLLSVDLNGDGIISDGSELFGEYTKKLDGTNAVDGYDALKQYDTNNDDILDSSDANFELLKIWQDSNSDGITDDSELKSLGEYGITQITLKNDDFEQTLENDNLISMQTNYSTNDSQGVVRDVWFQIDKNDNTGSLTSEAIYDFDEIEIDNEIFVDQTMTLSQAGISEIILETGYTGSGTGGTTAVTTVEGDDFSGILENLWFKVDTLDTVYDYEGDDTSNLNITAQGKVRDISHVMEDNENLADSVNSFKAQSDTSFFDLDEEMNSILEQWVLQDDFGDSSQTTPPIVLDLNNNKITSTSLEASNAYFDYDGDGRREKTGWIEKDDGLLVVDINEDGIINDGSELFGAYTKFEDNSSAVDGYNALSQYDSNEDGIIDNADDKFEKLNVWKDSNQNGKSDVGEIYSLQELGISSLDLYNDFQDTFEPFDENGNEVSYETTITKDGEAVTMRDVWFAHSNKHSIAVSNLSDEDEKKLSIIETYLGKQLTQEQRNNPFIVEAAFNQYNMIKYDTMAKLIANELYGEDFPSCSFLYDAMNNTLARVASGSSNEREKDLIANMVAAVLKRDSSSAMQELNHTYLTNANVQELLNDREVDFVLVNKFPIGQIGNQYTGTDSAETYDFSSKNGVEVYANGGNDVLIGSDKRDRLNGGSGDDIIKGNGGVDILVGGKGNDLLVGGVEQTAYVYNFGDGDDIIYDQGDNEQVDMLMFNFIDMKDVQVSRDSDDMVIKIKSQVTSFDNPSGQIVIKNGYTSGKIEEFYFGSENRVGFDELSIYTASDTSYFYDQGHSKLKIRDIGGYDKVVFGENVSLSNIVVKQSENDLLIGLAYENRPFNELQDLLTIENFFVTQNTIEKFIFSDGTVLTSETIVDFDQNNSFIVDTADVTSTTLYGDEGNNIFANPSSDNLFVGKGGNDQYVFSKGSGKDTILDNGGVDTLLFGLDISREDIISKVIGNDIAVAIKEDGKSFEELSDTITIKNWQSNNYAIENVQFADGKSYSIKELLNQSPKLEEKTVSITLQDTRETSGQIDATDPDGDTLSYTVTTDAEHGTITVDDEGKWTYNVAGHYIGSDSAVISIDDGNGGVVEQTLNFDAKVSNPTIANTTFELLEDESSNATLNIANPIGGVLTYEVVSPSTNAEFSVDVNGEFTYTPNENYNGSDNVEVKVTNEYGLSATTTLEFEIEAVNDAPVANADNVTTSENAILTISADDILANDIDVDVNDTLTITSVTALSDKGSVSLKDNGDIVFETGSDFDYLAVGESETVTVEYEIKDSAGEVSSSTIALTINGTNDIPEIMSEIEPIITLQDSRETSGQIEATDPDGDTLTYGVKTQPNNGAITVDANGTWTYSVAGHYIGSDSAVISIDDGNGGVVEQTLNFDAKVSSPTIANTTFELLEDESSNATLNIANPVGGALTYEVLSSSNNAAFSIDENGAFTYTPNANYNGSDSVKIKVTNEYGLSTTTTLNFEVEAVNDAPELQTPVENIDLVNIREVDGTIEASDVDGNSLTYTVTSNVSHGELSVDQEGNWHYRADAHYNGSDGATITIDDGNGGVVEKILNFSREGYIYEGDDLVINDGNGDSLSLEHINKSDLDFDQSGNDMLIHVQSDNATITLKDYFKDADKGVDTLLTKQGAISLHKDVIESSNSFCFFFGYNNSSNSDTDTLIEGSRFRDYLESGKGNDILFGSLRSDTLYGNDGDDLLIGNSGNDKLYGEVGNDELFGGSGRDRLYGGAGDDFLIGGQGKDYLEGGLGNDTYMFEKGDGVDTVYDSEPSTRFLWWNIEKPDGGEDTVLFGDSVSKEDISFYEKNGDLYLQYSEDDHIIIQNQDKKESQIEKVQLSNGNYLSHEDIELVIQNIHAYAQDNGIHRINNDTIRKNEELMQIVQSAWS
jgi:VCBS repeat-containing protein